MYMLEKLLERLKNQELTQQEEKVIQEQIVEIGNQLESNKQKRRIDALININNDEKRSQELKEIKSKLHTVRKKERRRALISTILSIPLALLFIGSVFGSVMLAGLFNFDALGVAGMMLASCVLSTGVMALVAMKDLGLKKKYKTEERCLLGKYNSMLFSGCKEKSKEQKSSFVLEESYTKNNYREEEISEDLLEESNTETF